MDRPEKKRERARDAHSHSWMNEHAARKYRVRRFYRIALGRRLRRGTLEAEKTNFGGFPGFPDLTLFMSILMISMEFKRPKTSSFF